MRAAGKAFLDGTFSHKEGEHWRTPLTLSERHNGGEWMDGGDGASLEAGEYMPGQLQARPLSHLHRLGDPYKG